MTTSSSGSPTNEDDGADDKLLLATGITCSTATVADTSSMGFRTGLKLKQHHIKLWRKLIIQATHKKQPTAWTNNAYLARCFVAMRRCLTAGPPAPGERRAVADHPTSDGDRYTAISSPEHRSTRAAPAEITGSGHRPSSPDYSLRRAAHHHPPPPSSSYPPPSSSLLPPLQQYRELARRHVRDLGPPRPTSRGTSCRSHSGGAPVLARERSPHLLSPLDCPHDPTVPLLGHARPSRCHIGLGISWR